VICVPVRCMRCLVRSELLTYGGSILSGVAATNALELGVDVGVLDVTLHLGFPGSVASVALPWT